MVLSESSMLITGTTSSGDAGRLSVFTDTLQLTGGATLLSGSLVDPISGEIPVGHGGAISVQGQTGPANSVHIDGQGSGIFTNTEGTGQAGNIVLNGSTVTLQNGGTISASTKGLAPSATGGSIIINATDQVTLNNQASITVSSGDPNNPSAGGKADAGNISVNAGQRLEIRDSFITAEATKASGGNIEIKAIDLIRVANGSISSSVQGGPSTSGGNITIDPKTVVLQDAQILASAAQGNGGNITITTPLFLKDSLSIVDASSQVGLNGTVTIQSPTSNLSGTVGQLASKTTPPQVLLQNRCIASGEQSTFIVAGRDALPAEPGGWLSSPVAMEHWTGENIEEHVSVLMARSIRRNQSPAMIASTDAGQTLSLRRLTPPGFLGRTFAIGHTGCPS